LRQRTASSRDPQHGLDNSSIVLAATARTARLAKAKRRHLRPLSLSQNESVNPWLESHPSRTRIPNLNTLSMIEMMLTNRRYPCPRNQWEMALMPRPTLKEVLIFFSIVLCSAMLFKVPPAFWIGLH
jgi:hypothetical protein